jgi:hypothetical protein
MFNTLSQIGTVTALPGSAVLVAPAHIMQRVLISATAAGMSVYHAPALNGQPRIVVFTLPATFTLAAAQRACRAAIR